MLHHTLGAKLYRIRKSILLTLNILLKLSFEIKNRKIYSVLPVL